MNTGPRFLVRTLWLLASAKSRALLCSCLLAAVMMGVGACEPPGFSAELQKFHEWKAPPRWHPERNSIVFSHGDYGAFYEQLYEVSTDGTLVTLIPGMETEGANDLRQIGSAASISPDLSRLTFADYEHDSWVPWLESYDWEIVTTAPDGSDNRRLTNSEGWDYAPVWSPDGSRIAFLSTRLGATNILTMAPNGSELKSIAPSASGGFSPLVWSPDGSHIAFALFSTDDLGWVLHAVDVDGSGLTRLGDTITPPAWSSESSQLAFLAKDGAKTVLRTILADGSNLKKVNELDRELTRKTTNVTNNLAWSPDGSRILLSGKNRVAVVGGDGSEFKVLTDLNMGVAGPFLYSSWSPDGSKIAVNPSTNTTNVSNGFHPVLYTMNPDGSNKKILAKYVIRTHHDKYGNILGRVESAHGESWLERFERTSSRSIPEPAPLNAEETPTTQGPRAEAPHSRRPRALMPDPAEQVKDCLAVQLASAQKQALDPPAAWALCTTEQFTGLMGGVTRRWAKQIIQSLTDLSLAREERG